MENGARVFCSQPCDAASFPLNDEAFRGKIKASQSSIDENDRDALAQCALFTDSAIHYNGLFACAD